MLGGRSILKDKPSVRLAAGRVNTVTTAMVVRRPQSGWRVSGERRAEGEERIRCTL